VEVFAGNTSDPTSFISAAQAVRERFGLADVVMVGDRGMITSARTEALKAVGGLGWLTSLRAPQVAALMSSGTLQMSLFDEVNLAEISHPDYPGERLVACRDPALAKERTRKREELLAATEALLAEVKAAVERDKRPYRGKDRIALRVGKLINRYKVGKHFELRVGEDSFGFSRKADQISAEAALDGIYVVRASAAHVEGLSPAKLVKDYKDLKVNEAALKSLKTIDFEVPAHLPLDRMLRATLRDHGGAYFGSGSCLPARACPAKRATGATRVC
jgi:transposase